LWQEQINDSSGRFVLLRRNYMGVKIHCSATIGMLQKFLCNLDIRTRVGPAEAANQISTELSGIQILLN